MFRYAVSPSGARKFRVTGRFDRSGRACCFAGNAARRARVDISAVGWKRPGRRTAGASHAPEEVPCPPCFPIPRPCWPWRRPWAPASFPARLLLFGVFCAVLPDLDVIGFKLGIRYADLLGHRGFSHSLLFALLMGLFGAALAPWLRCSRPAAFGVGLAAVASHILLDAMTNGGLGVAALWPLDKARYFLDWRPIRVSPLNLRVFFGRQGLEVLISEWRLGPGCPAWRRAPRPGCCVAL